MPATTFLDDDASRKHDTSPRDLRVEKAPFFVDVCELGLLFSLPISAQCTTTNTATTQQASKRLQLSPSPSPPLQQLQRDRSTPRGARKTTAHTRTEARSLFLASALGNANRTLSKDRQRHLQPLGNARLTLRKRCGMPSSALASMQDCARQGYGSFT